MTPNDEHEFPQDDNPSDESPADFEQNPPEDEFDEFTDLPGLPAPDDLVLDDENAVELHAESDSIAEPLENGDNDTVAEVNASPPDDVQNFENLTLAELTGQFLRAPRRTAQAVSGVVLTPVWSSTQPLPALPSPQKQREGAQQDPSPARPVGFLPEVGYPATTAELDAEERLDRVD